MSDSRQARTACWFLVAGLLVATLDEGGARATGMLATHLLLVLGAAWLLVGPTRSPAPAAGPQAAFAVFAVCVMAAAWSAPYAYAALLVVVEIATFYLALRLGAACGAALVERLAWPLLLVGAAQGAWAIVQHWVLGQRRPAGSFLNPNHLAAWLVAALALGVVARWPAATRAERAWRLVLASPIVVGLGLAASRGALLGLGLAALWWTWVSWRGLDLRSRRVAALVGVGLLAAGSWLVWARAAEPDPYRYHRLHIWRASFQPALDRPWTGVGPGQWGAAAPRLNFPNTEAPLRYERRLDSTHSDLLRLPAEFGWPATLAALTALMLAVAALRRRYGGPEMTPPVKGALAALLALGGQALVDNPSQRPALYLLAGALLGALLASRRTVGERASPPCRWLLAGLLLGAWGVADLSPYRAWLLARGAEASLDSSLRANPLHYDTWMRRAERRSRGEDAMSAAAYAVIREDGETAVRLNPEDAATRTRLARLERRAFLERFRDRASRERIDALYRRAQDLAPTDPFIALERAAFLLDAGDPAGARRAAERALSIEPNAVPGHLLSALALLAEDGTGAAVSAQRRVEQALAIEQRFFDTPLQTDYARRLLRADPVLLDRVRAGLQSASEVAE